jgi:release factor glutamine methyltransferase
VGIKEAYQSLAESIHPLYDLREARNIADLVMEKLTGWERSKRIVHADLQMTEDQQTKYDQFKYELLHGRPVQYVLKESWFYGFPFYVDEHVLIPRPETEELVDLIRKEQEQRSKLQEKKNILDIGTGSGCIAISLKKTFPYWEIWAIDDSEAALEIAKKNAASLQVELHFNRINILHPNVDHQLPPFDLIVSNPPYIPEIDKQEMAKHVLDFEPHQALFVTNNDPLQFYRSIVAFSDEHLMRGGYLYFETHSSYANQIAALMEDNMFEEIEVCKDLQGLDRIVKGRRPGASL